MLESLLQLGADPTRARPSPASLFGSGGVLAGDRGLARGECPLHLATHPAIARLLLDGGAAVDVRDAHGNTPLLLRCKEAAAAGTTVGAGVVAACEALLEHGAKFGRRVTDTEGNSPAQLAAKSPPVKAAIEAEKRFMRGDYERTYNCYIYSCTVTLTKFKLFMSV